MWHCILSCNMFDKDMLMHMFMLITVNYSHIVVNRVQTFSHLLSSPDKFLKWKVIMSSYLPFAINVIIMITTVDIAAVSIFTL